MDDDGNLLRSFAQEQGQTHLFAPVGKEFRKMDVKEPIGTAHYVIHVYGTGPDGADPDTTKSGSLAIDIDLAPAIPEFPVGVMIIMALIVAISIVITRFKNITNLKF